MPALLPLLEGLSWFDRNPRSLSPFDMLQRYEGGFKDWGVVADPSEPAEVPGRPKVLYLVCQYSIRKISSRAEPNRAQQRAQVRRPTRCVLQLAGADDFAIENEVKVSQLQYDVIERVTELTAGLQHPVARQANPEDDFVVWRTPEPPPRKARKTKRAAPPKSTR